MSEQFPLSSPPNYEYVSKGPWFVTHTFDDGAAMAWILHTADMAVLRFWFCPTTPTRRVMVDVRGITVLGTDSTDPELPRMSGTREMMDATLKLVEGANPMLESQAQVLTMIDMLQRLDGQAI